MTASGASGQDLISVDFGALGGSQMAYGVEPNAAAADPLFAAATVWNHLEEAPLAIVPNPSYPGLLDSLGASTPAELSMTGDTSFYGFMNAETLLGDFLFFNSPNNPEPSIDWEITGLVPNAVYAMYFYGSKANFARSFEMWVDTNADGALGDETPQMVGSVDVTASVDAYFPAVLSDATGRVSGRGVGLGTPSFDTEANWGGFQIAFVEASGEVVIDIKPDSSRNPINPASQGVVPVAILGSAGLDVADVDVTTLAFGPGAAPPAHDAGGHLADVNEDGFTDLLSHYRTPESGLAWGDTEACVSGELLDGTAFEACDTIQTLPRCGLGPELVLLLPPLLAAYRRRRARG
jgi:hypothetical protein